MNLPQFGIICLLIITFIFTLVFTSNLGLIDLLRDFSVNHGRLVLLMHDADVRLVILSVLLLLLLRLGRLPKWKIELAEGRGRGGTEEPIHSI